MPAKFRFLDHDPAFILPLQFDRNKEFLGHFSYPGIARLRPGVSLEQGSADIARMIPAALHSFPPAPGFTVKAFEDVRLAPKMHYLKVSLIGDLAKTLWVLMGTIAIVLLIACANVANLLLARAEARRHELAIRVALGAGWGDVARELLMESVALGMLGGVLGLGLAYASVRLLIAIAPAHLPRLREISIDPIVVLFTLGVALLTSLVFGMIPVLKYAGPQIANALHGAGRTASDSRERHRARSVLVVVQVGLAVVLLVGSGLMIRTFVALRHVDPGFNPKEALTMHISIPASQVSDPTTLVQMEQQILNRVRSIPGVTAVGLSSGLPTESYRAYQVYARDKSYADKTPPLRWLKFVSPGLLQAMGNRLVAGRDFTWNETYERRPVAMVSENLARELWQDPQLAIGKEIRENSTGPWREVVGVVNDQYESGVQVKAPPEAYYPLLMNNFQGNSVVVQRIVWYVVRSKRVGSQGFLTDLQRAVWSVNGNLPLANVRTLQQIYDRSLASTSFTLVILAIAGAMALLIGLVGIYGVISYSVSQRTREIGIRMALGACRNEVKRIFIAHGFVLATIGVGCGLCGAAALTRVLASLLFDVNPLDPLTYAAVSIALVTAAVIASYIPALRAMAVSPTEAMRAE
jgi:putative ABC transport system permease protein